jgi:hypothetical protein
LKYFRNTLIQMYTWNYLVGVEVFTAVAMKSDIVWDVTSCSSLKDDRYVGGICCFYLQGQRESQARKKTFFLMPVSCCFIA